MSATPPPLPENTGLAFTGESAWSPASITEHQARELAATRNPAGRPNSDVLRSFVGKRGRSLRKHWQIDFPAHYREQEAALHEKPLALLKKALGGRAASEKASAGGASSLATQDARSREQPRSHKPENQPTAFSGPWWINPHAQPPLRQALARLDRFLATTLDSPEPSWAWLESEHLPDHSLLVVTRDDDFSQAVLQSTAFTTWWHAHFRQSAPTRVIESFPFPWPPAAPLGSLTKIQQHFRSAVARAAISGDADQIDSAVAAAYGWPSKGEEGEMLAALHELHRKRIGR